MTAEDRDNLRRQDALRTEQEARDEYNAEQMANNSGLTTAKGRIFRRIRPQALGGLLTAGDHFSRASAYGLAGPLTMMAVIDSLGRAAEAAHSLVSNFVHPATGKQQNQTDANGIYEDDTHIYETVAVSRATQKLLAVELAMVRLRSRELQETPKDSQLYQEKASDLEGLMERCRIRIHPLNGRYVHCITRVMEEEAQLNRDSAVPDDGLAHVFYCKASGHDSLRISRDIADQFDDALDEKGADADVKAPPPRPLLPDGFHYRHS